MTLTVGNKETTNSDNQWHLQ